MQDVLARFPFIIFAFIKNFTGMIHLLKIFPQLTPEVLDFLCACLGHVKLILVSIHADSAFYSWCLCESTCLLFLHISFCCDVHSFMNDFLSVVDERSYGLKPLHMEDVQKNFVTLKPLCIIIQTLLADVRVHILKCLRARKDNGVSIF